MASRAYYQFQTRNGLQRYRAGPQADPSRENPTGLWYIEHTRTGRIVSADLTEAEAINALASARARQAHTPPQTDPDATATP